GSRGGRRWPWAVALLATAAAALLLLALCPPAGWRGPGAGPAERAEEPFPVATEDEVEIVSVEGPGADVLVVGEPPVRGEIELALPGEVTVMDVQPAADSMMPEVFLEGPDAPMIRAPLDEPPADKNP